MQPFIRLIGARRIYQSEGQPVTALDNLSLEIEAGDYIALTGPSGCGKSTLLHLLGGLDRPDSGEIYIGDVAMHSADDRTLTRFRRDTLGIVFQFFNLLQTMTVRENVALPLLLQGVPTGRALASADEQIAMVGLTGRAGHLPHQLSGGEMQRAAIARAMVHRPKLLLADEPTGNLDSSNAAQVLEVFDEIHQRKLTTLLLVTHEPTTAQRANRIIRLRDGRLDS